jgi:hypothetical protein
MQNLAATYQKLGKYTEGEKLQIQAREVQSRVFEGQHFQKIKTMHNVKDAQNTQVLNARRTASEEATSDLVPVVLNPPVQAVLPDTIIILEKKGVYFGNCILNLFLCFYPQFIFLPNLHRGFQILNPR